MNIKNKIKSINFKTLVYLIIFSIAILLFLMLSQSILLKYSYEKYQEKKIQKITLNIKNETINNLYYNLENIAYNNSVCIKYVTNTNTINYNILMVGCGLKNNNQVTNIINDIIAQNENLKYIKLINNSNNSRAILSGVKVENGYIFIYSPLEDLNGARYILHKELVLITIIVVFIACFISYFLSKKITKPIVKITKKAQELGEGNYQIKFDSSDILEINELANTLNHVSSDLSKIDELRRDLMANVSHDLKTPLTMIRAYAEMIRDISYADEAKTKENLNIIIEEVERLNILVNDILELSRMQATNDELKLENFDLCAIINDIMKKYEILKTTEDYHFILDIPPKLIVYADKQKITQVIYNLINNALNYTGSDKKVFITIKKIKKEVLIEITDTGKGIKKEELPYIWDKYYKSDKLHRRNVVSTGLGLSIVKEILTKHKFDYGVKSTLNKGTTFYFKIKTK